LLTNSDATFSRDRIFPDDFWSSWFFPVINVIRRTAPNSKQEKDLLSFDSMQIMSLPWNIINFIDADRIPQISAAAESYFPDIATRHNYAIEDVPLINKVTIFNIFGGKEGNQDPPPPPLPGDADAIRYFELDSATDLSNHYAVAIEIWYPFAPNFPPANAAIYAHLWTNETDVVTTTNRPLSGSERADWFRFNEALTSNTVMQTLFYSWAHTYTNAVGPGIWRHPLWQTVTADSGLWFTTNMASHSSWPVADENGNVTITNTPIWNAFYPETYESVETNQVEQVVTNEADTVVTNFVDNVTTNVYTYLNTTNAYVQWVTEPEMTTNRFSGQIAVTDPEPYPVLMWHDLSETQYTTNVLYGFIDPAGNTNLFYNGTTTNHLQNIYATPPDGINVVSSNGLTGAAATNLASAFILAPWTTNAPLAFTVETNFYVETEILPVAPLPMPVELGETLDALFGILLAPELSLDTSTALYDFLMLQFNEFDRRLLDAYLNQYPIIQQTIMPSRRMESLGNMTLDDRISLCDPADGWNGLAIVPKDFRETLVGERYNPGEKDFGTWWVVYPKQTVSFPEITYEKSAEGHNGDELVAVTNYHALGSSDNFHIWLQANVTVNRHDTMNRDTDEEGVVDVAFLTKNGNSVQGWWSVTNACVADPRHNAYAAYWRGFPNPDFPNDPTLWNSAIGTTNLSTEVTEYPFLHFNTPLATIGDIGHIYASQDRRNMTWSLFDDTSKSRIKQLIGLLRLPEYPNELPASNNSESNSDLYRRLDTVAFNSRSGAALLDLLTIRTHTTPMRGLIQANTEHPAVIETLFSFGTLGWTNYTDQSFYADLSDPSDLSDWSDIYRDALTNTPPAGIGWRSFADMLPAIATNKLLQARYSPPFADAPAHDWIEDAVRHLPDRVSFRQNIFVVVIAAQTLSPASTPSRPVVLADQRAAVTVIRDAYTGRWTLHSWRWLTE
jgi:hypothetical protein